MENKKQENEEKDEVEDVEYVPYEVLDEYYEEFEKCRGKTIRVPLNEMEIDCGYVEVYIPKLGEPNSSHEEVMQEIARMMASDSCYTEEDDEELEVEEGMTITFSLLDELESLFEKCRGITIKIPLNGYELDHSKLVDVYIPKKEEPNSSYKEVIQKIANIPDIYDDSEAFK